jgi:hypothetical protein
MLTAASGYCSRPLSRRNSCAVFEVFLLAVLTAFAVPSPAEAAPGSNSPPAPAPSHAVVVELFTSQGCMTCPPADQILSALGQQNPGRVIPLAFHVDFWNQLGWKDPFSRHAWTERQEAYSRALRVGRIYTPQAVVNGRSEMIGSDANRLLSSITNAAARPAATIGLELAPADSRVSVRAQVDLPEELQGRKLDLMIALFETGLVTAVGRGENGGKTLHNDYVVRELRRVGRLAPKGLPKTQHAADIGLEKEWDRGKLGVAAFVQDPASLEILGASSALLAAPPSERSGS